MGKRKIRFLVAIIVAVIATGRLEGRFVTKGIVIYTNNSTIEYDAVPVMRENQETIEDAETGDSAKKYRLTSYWYGDGSSKCTGTGLCTKDFKINDKGWYTYEGKLVLAAATNACLKSKSGACGKWNTPDSRDYYNYYDTVSLEIDGVVYEGIILDSCGASMYVDNEQRLDLFVSNKTSAIDRGYKGKNTIKVWN